MKDKLLFKRNATKTGGSITIAIPPEVLEYLEIKEGTKIALSVDKGKYGRFAAFWSIKQQEKSEKNVC